MGRVLVEQDCRLTFEGKDYRVAIRNDERTISLTTPDGEFIELPVEIHCLSCRDFVRANSARQLRQKENILRAELKNGRLMKITSWYALSLMAPILNTSRTTTKDRKAPLSHGLRKLGPYDYFTYSCKLRQERQNKQKTRNSPNPSPLSPKTKITTKNPKTALHLSPIATLSR